MTDRRARRGDREGSCEAFKDGSGQVSIVIHFESVSSPETHSMAVGKCLRHAHSLKALFTRSSVYESKELDSRVSTVKVRVRAAAKVAG